MKIIVLPILMLTILIVTGCSVPVCCKQEPRLTSVNQGYESELRQELIITSLTYYENRQFKKLAELYAIEVRVLFDDLINIYGSQRSDEEILSYVEYMHDFEFSKETKLIGGDKWKLVYRNKNYRNQFTVYTIIKEEGMYRIFDMQMASVL